MNARTRAPHWFLLALPVFLTGCSSPTPPVPASPVLGSVSEPSRKASTVQTFPVYQEAVRLYEQKHYAEAITRIEHLLPLPTLSDSDRAFLTHQKQLCERALAGKPERIASLRLPKPVTASGKKVAVTLPASKPPSRRPEQADCGPRALALVCHHLGVSAEVAELRTLSGTTGYGTTLGGLQKAAEAKGLKAEGVQMDGIALQKMNGCAVAWVDGDHYLAVYRVEGEKATVQDPNTKEPEMIATETLLRRSGGILLTVRR